MYEGLLLARGAAKARGARAAAALEHAAAAGDDEERGNRVDGGRRHGEQPFCASQSGRQLYFEHHGSHASVARSKIARPSARIAKATPKRARRIKRDGRLQP